MKREERSAFGYARRRAGALAASVGIGLAGHGVALYMGVVARPAVDELIDAGDRIAQFAVFIAVLGGVRALCAHVASYLANRTGMLVVQELREDAVSVVLVREKTMRALGHAGELQTRIINDSQVVGMFIADHIPATVVLATSVAGAMVLAVVTSPFLAAIVAAGVAGLFAPLAWINSRLRNKGHLAQSAEALAGKTAGEILVNVAVVAAFGQQSREQTRFRKQVQEATDQSVGALKIQAVFGGTLNAAAWCLAVFVVWLGASRVAAGTMSLGTVVAFSYFLILVVNNGSSLVSRLAIAASAVGMMGRLLEIVATKKYGETERTEAPVPNFVSPVVPTIGLSLRAVSYRYETRRAFALRDVTLNIEAGERVAVVGASGAGKSTLFELILRLSEPTAGTIQANGVDISRIPLENWRSRIGYVPQTEQLMSGTVAYNIGYGRPGASYDDIVEASLKANLHEFVAGLPQGYDTDVGQLGDELSGGQRQRIALARALLKNPAILLLDEATSALDAESEDAIERSLRKVGKSATMLVACHRIRSVLQCDRVVVFDRGVVVDEGRHETLRRRSTLYQRVMGIGG